MGFFKKHFSRTKLNINLLLILLGVFAVLSVLIAIGIGPVTVSPFVVAKILLSKIPFVGGFVDNSWQPVEFNIVMGLRLPRVILGMVIGASLAVCGVTMQALVRNHLAEPFP